VKCEPPGVAGKPSDHPPDRPSRRRGSHDAQTTATAGIKVGRV